MSVAPLDDSAPVPPQSLLCLCLGNICRSPLAEGILRREVESRGLKGWVVDSAGTSGEHDGDAPDDRSIAVAKRMGIDISKQVSRRLTKEDWTKFNYILASVQVQRQQSNLPPGSLASMLTLDGLLVCDRMDSSNYRNAMRVKPPHATAELVMYLPKGDVPDPWYGSDSGFTDCYNLLNKHASYIFDTIAKKYGKAAL